METNETKNTPDYSLFTEQVESGFITPEVKEKIDAVIKAISEFNDVAGTTAYAIFSYPSLVKRDPSEKEGYIVPSLTAMLNGTGKDIAFSLLGNTGHNKAFRQVTKIIARLVLDPNKANLFMLRSMLEYGYPIEEILGYLGGIEYGEITDGSELADLLASLPGRCKSCEREASEEASEGEAELAQSEPSSEPSEPKASE